MPELLSVLKELKINSKQLAGPNYSNQAYVTMVFPRKRLNINVTRNIQNSNNEGYSN